jgi:pimeloyl-ACP methyl ester carboxylesterase
VVGAMNEKPVTFLNRNGCRLFGMLYLPRATPGATRVGIVISVNAIKYRLGTFRMHVLLARALCGLGYTVFTFDPEGIGDSEGRFDHKLLSEHYHDIQHGKYNQDLADAIDFFVKAATPDCVLLMGLCGGAISVLMEAGGDPRVSGLILLNVPVLVEDLKRKGDEDNSAKITSSESASALLKGKLRRLADPAFWRKLSSRRVDVREEARLVTKAVSVLAQKSWRRIRGLVSKPARPVELARPVSTNRLFNMHFQNSFAQSMNSRKQVLFLFAELDPWTWIFKSEFQDLVLTPGNKYEPNYTHQVIPAANHIFSDRQSQQRLADSIVDWLARHFPVQQTRRAEG